MGLVKITLHAGMFYVAMHATSARFVTGMSVSLRTLAKRATTVVQSVYLASTLMTGWLVYQVAIYRWTRHVWNIATLTSVSTVQLVLSVSAVSSVTKMIHALKAIIVKLYKTGLTFVFSTRMRISYTLPRCRTP